MEAGAHGVPMDPAVKLVVEEQKAKLDPVTIHCHNMEVKPVQDKPQRVLAVTRIHVRKVKTEMSNLISHNVIPPLPTLTTLLV